MSPISLGLRTLNGRLAFTPKVAFLAAAPSHPRQRAVGGLYREPHSGPLTELVPRYILPSNYYTLPVRCLNLCRVKGHDRPIAQTGHPVRIGNNPDTCCEGPIQH